MIFAFSIFAQWWSTSTHLDHLEFEQPQSQKVLVNPCNSIEHRRVRFLGHFFALFVDLLADFQPPTQATHACDCTVSATWPKELRWKGQDPGRWWMVEQLHWGWPMGPFDCRIADAWVLGGYIDILMIMMVVFENVFIVIRCFGLVASSTSDLFILYTSFWRIRFAQHAKGNSENGDGLAFSRQSSDFCRVGEIT